uniref:Reverse transcriptase domain-containing protein n=1 Tax=Haemonchus contortus TaxID=6289 RepID=A0A7I4Y4S3_HAECO
MSLKESRCNATASAGADAHLQGPETRWSCCKSRDIGHGFEAVLCGGPKTTNGVGIIVSERFRDSIVGVERFDDRLMKIIVVIECQKYHFFSAYAPQAGCSEQTKDKFWNLLDEKTAEVPLQEALVVAGDLNGHVGATKDGYSCHGGFGYGSRNTDGERILEYADSHNLVIVNTKFHAKTVPYETVATQHRSLICTLKIAPPKPKVAERCGPARIKWWRPKEKEKESAVVSRILLPAVTTVDETWKSAVEAITRVARSELGMTKPGRRKIDKQTWLWTDHVRDKVREKKKQYHAFFSEKTADNWQRYQIAKKEAKKVVASVKAAHFAELNEKLESRDGERYVYRLAKTRHRQTEDIERFFGINDENGYLLTDRKQALKRWREYFENISTAEFAHPAIPCAPPVYGPVQKITVRETITAMKRMTSGKATGPDDLAADLWKSKCWNPAGWLTDFFNQVVAEKKVPESWQQSTTIPIWKKKGSPGDCACHRPIRLLSHSMKIFERIVDSRIRDIVELTTNQCGFVSGCSTIDAIHATRLLLEKHREKRRPVHLAFLDLEKAFDRVPRDVIWYALRQHGVPEELIEWVRILYTSPKSRVQTAAGISTDFPISVGVHQGSALSPLLFVVVMDAITKDLQKPAPWSLLYADDVMLASEDKSELESQVQTWSDRLARFGLRLNVKKTEYLTTDSSEPGSIKINGTELTRTTTFKYHGSALASDGSLGFETNSRVNAAWLKWRSMTGVLCDKNIPERLKSKIYRTVIRPVAIYGAECWLTTKEVEARLSAMETKMLRWTAGVTRLDRISNDAIRERFGVAPIVDKMREAGLRWYGHVLRADEGSVRKIGLNLDVSGRRPRGRPKQRWLDTLHEDLKTVNIHPD